MSAAETPRSPSIDHFEWGRISVAAYGNFKDVKLWPGGARPWDWDETGTRHEPGVQIADVEELLEHGAEIVVLSRGVHRRLQVQPETLTWLEARGVAVEVLQSEAAVARYNQLSATRKVGALIHSTC
ncbi:MAG TPA: Mth938-like domain-containing protein [Enhygromyxa sp.]|nr:Mth938-like domain-containing protein [Enhygromyxa sp.]